jgi:hypothetical protein
VPDILEIGLAQGVAEAEPFPPVRAHPRPGKSRGGQRSRLIYSTWPERRKCAQILVFTCFFFE